MAHSPPIMSDAGDKEGRTDSVIRRLNARKGQWREIFELADVPYDTGSKIARRMIPEPGSRKIDRLDNVLATLDAAEAERTPQLPLSLVPVR